ncbi:MAG TPA: hypothetical protein VGH99_01250 [Pseudonocardia sp.]|jgi:hypothetical protein
MPETMKSTDELYRAAGLLEDWLDLQSFEDAANDVDGDQLRVINALAVTGASERELARAVKSARDHGWSWTPIAMVLGITRKEVVERFSRAIGHPVARRWRRGS